MAAKKKRCILLMICAAILLALIIWIAWGNQALELNTYVITSEKLPAAFDGYRIAHISDLHNTEMGHDNEKLLAMLREADPDMIAITGDFVDSRRTDIDISLRFVREAVKIAPCYYVAGNHEARIPEYPALKTGLQDAGVTVLGDMGVKIGRDGEYITVLGVDDPSFQTDYLLGDADVVISEKLAQLKTENDGFTVLLSHRPELFHTYVAGDMDLVLSGHAHGGQFRIPLIGGLFAPNQGFFPEYDAGCYAEENTNMIVSRGVGNSLFPFRINNRPEVILIELDGRE